MNQVILSGSVVNEPKYAMFASQQRTVLRALLLSEGSVPEEQALVPLVFFDAYAERARREVQKGSRIIAYGYIAGSPYEDESGAKNYQHFLVVTTFQAVNLDISQKSGEKASECVIMGAGHRLPLDVSDFEDIIQFLERSKKGGKNGTIG